MGIYEFLSLLCSNLMFHMKGWHRTDRISFSPMTTQVVSIHPLRNTVYFIWTPGAISVNYRSIHTSHLYMWKLCVVPNTTARTCHASATIITAPTPTTVPPPPELTRLWIGQKDGTMIRLILLQKKAHHIRHFEFKLTFGYHSSKFPFVLHHLDDLLVADIPSAPPACSISSSQKPLPWVRYTSFRRKPWAVTYVWNVLMLFSVPQDKLSRIKAIKYLSTAAIPAKREL